MAVSAATIAEIRQRAAAHQEELDAYSWFTIADLAARWKVSETTVREIPIEDLWYKEFGQGAKLKMRRYPPWSVAAFERPEAMAS